ncbi:MAG: LuxR C-terminal-related transcriptional regulator [Acidimicrobiia bacterium]
MERGRGPIGAMGLSAAATAVGLNRFVGRAVERERLHEAVREHRLVSLIGPGGMGKSRLAAECASSLGAALAGGVVWCELVGVRDERSLADAIVSAAGLEHSSVSSLQAAIDAFAQRRSLLVLDNCEHLLDAVRPLVRALLGACPHLHLLCTSRAPLGVDGECLLSLGPLAPETDAVELFVDRTLSACPDLTPAALPRWAVAELCAMLDGLPLAIELASARMRSMSVAELTDRLTNQRLALHDRHRADARHRTMAAVIDWSMRLLPGPLQRRAVALAVFSGGFDLEAAHAVSGGSDDERHTIDAVQELVDHSFLQVRRGGESTRFTMLETVRQALWHRAGAEQRSAIVDRHVRYHLALAEEADSGLMGADQLVWLDRLELEHDNLRAALLAALDRDDGELALGIAGSLGWFWRMRGHMAEGHRWLALALTATEKAIDPAAISAPASVTTTGPTLAARRVRALNSSGLLAPFLFDLTGARAHFDEARRSAVELGDRAACGWAEHGLGRVALEERSEAAGAHFAASIVAFDEAGDERSAAYSSYFLAFVQFRDGNVDEAAARFRSAHAVLEAMQDTWGLATLYLMWSNVPAAAGRIAEAADLQRRGIRCAGWLGSPTIVGRALLNLAATAHQAHRHDVAVMVHRAAADLAGAHGAIVRTTALADKHLDAARALLTDVELDAAWAAGACASVIEAAEIGRRAAVALANDRAGIGTGDEAGTDLRAPSPVDALTDRERQMLAGVATGATNKQLARRFAISVRTVEVHLSRVYSKLGVANRVEATLLWLGSPFGDRSPGS